MFGYLDNGLSINGLLNNATVTTTQTPTGIDCQNAVGPIGLTFSAASGGSGTLSLQPVMSTDNTTFVNVPADAILDPTTGLQTTFANYVGSVGTSVNGVTVYLKKDELMRYISLTLTNVGGAGSITASARIQFMRGYTSQSV